VLSHLILVQVDMISGRPIKPYLRIYFRNYLDIRRMTMLRILTASSLLALAATPALAQQTAPMAQPTPEASVAQPNPEAAPAPAEPMTAAPMDPATQAAPTAPAPEPKEVTVQKLVDAEFPTYDANKNGDLDQAEFSKWVLALQGAASDPKAAAMDDAAKAKWAKAAFASADADKSKKVSKDEMNKFLLG
jgi:outer membrane biosynthesis protein TonB